MLAKKRFLSLIIFLLISLNLSANTNFSTVQTTRLKSTGGAGVGSILMEEATFLNPAPIAFYNLSSVYLQKTGTDNSNLDNSPFRNPESDQMTFVASDGK